MKASRKMTITHPVEKLTMEQNAMKFAHPSRIMIVGSTHSGKSSLIAK